MFKIYMRLLGFARPIRKYAIPYFFYSLFYALFNSHCSIRSRSC